MGREVRSEPQFPRHDHARLKLGEEVSLNFTTRLVLPLPISFFSLFRAQVDTPSCSGPIPALQGGSHVGSRNPSPTSFKSSLPLAGLQAPSALGSPAPYIYITSLSIFLTERHPSPLLYMSWSTGHSSPLGEEEKESTIYGLGNLQEDMISLRSPLHKS